VRWLVSSTRRTDRGAVRPVVRHEADRAGPAPWGWRGLGVFWISVLVILAVGGATLQWLGPPASPPRVMAGLPPSRPGVVAVRVHPGRTATGPITGPDPLLIEGTTGAQDHGAVGLPRIAPDGRAPMQVYAAGFDPTTKTPRIGLVLAGIGPDAAASTDAIAALPAAVTLAISPYTTAPDGVLQAARLAGHEYMLSIPMEPQGYPQNDPGPRALSTAVSPAENAQRLDWILGRMAGYAGVTGAFGEMRGERFAAVADQMGPVLASLASRGLLYVDPRPGAAPLPSVWSCDVDVVIDDPASPDSIDEHLAELERRAHDTGVAIGLVSAPRPGTIAHIKAWAGNLAARGAVLAPISALVARPAAASSPKAAP
jgi:uncharacterized protein